MIKIEKLTLQKYLDYSSELQFAGGQITRDGALLLIECNSNEEELDAFDRPVLKRDWIIRIIKNEKIETVKLTNVPLIPAHIDLFSDGTLLIVQARCLKDGEYTERNARRYNMNGQLIEVFTLGDGIGNMQIDENDTIWVNYFDEGIFGGFGWEQTMGRDGLVAYTIDGDKLWGAGEYDIIDGYALNVADSSEIYFYYYDDYFLVQLDNMEERNRYRVEGHHWLNQFIFAQDSLIAQLDMNKLTRFKIRNQTIIKGEGLELVDEHGKRIAGPVFMRGNSLYVYGKNGIYKREF